MTAGGAYATPMIRGLRAHQDWLKRRESRATM